MLDQVLGTIIVLLTAGNGVLWYVNIRHLIGEKFGVGFMDPGLVLFRKDCNKCSGGVQALVEGEWGPFPQHWKMEQREGNNRGWFSSPYANRRRCKCCVGKGFHLAAKDEVELPYPRG